MVASAYHTVPELESRPGDVRIPLRVRVLRRHEGIQGQERQHQIVQAGQEHGPSKQVFGAYCIAQLRPRCDDRPDWQVR